MQDLFKEKSKTWDKGDVQTNTAMAIASAIKSNIALSKSMEILDFGVGTGLLGFEIAKTTKKVYGIDTSPGMLEKVKEKNSESIHIETFCQDIVEKPLNLTVDGLVSSMTLHHIENLEAFFKTIYKNIHKDGFIAIADLESEDGNFHEDNTGVFHFGFKQNELCDIVNKCGFNDVKFQTITTINKTNESFNVFLLTAKK